MAGPGVGIYNPRPDRRDTGRFQVLECEVSDVRASPGGRTVLCGGRWARLRGTEVSADTSNTRRFLSLFIVKAVKTVFIEKR